MMSSPPRGCFGASSVGEIRNGKVGNNKRNSRVSFCAFLKEKVPMIQSARVVLRLARFPAGTCRTFKSSIYFKKVAFILSFDGLPIQSPISHFLFFPFAQWTPNTCFGEKINKTIQVSTSCYFQLVPAAAAISSSYL